LSPFFTSSFLPPLPFPFLPFLPTSLFSPLPPFPPPPSFSLFFLFSLFFSSSSSPLLLFLLLLLPLFSSPSPPSFPLSPLLPLLFFFSYIFFSRFHYGLTGWSMYALMVIALGYFSYRYNLPLTIRSALYPIFGKRINGPIGHSVVIAAVIG
ncbi:BCCT family transporter, partial [Escherichia coli]|uniref:BCCT family transporter n=1 Tax=Escherichia coli TaxID=562 RepID=UPI00147D4883